jgi:hypothetical protein
VVVEEGMDLRQAVVMAAQVSPAAAVVVVAKEVAQAAQELQDKAFQEPQALPQTEEVELAVLGLRDLQADPEPAELDHLGHLQELFMQLADPDSLLITQV